MPTVGAAGITDRHIFYPTHQVLTALSRKALAEQEQPGPAYSTIMLTYPLSAADQESTIYWTLTTAANQNGRSH
jgi:hypothetical protein